MSRPFIPAKKCASVELIWNYNGVTCENIIHVQKSTEYDAADLVALRTLVNTWDATSYSPYRSGTGTLNRIRTRALDTAASPVEDYTLPTPRSGGYSFASFPNNVSLCVKLATGLAGRSYRGRWYVIGIPYNFVGTTQNQIRVDLAALYVAALETLRATLALAGHALSVVSYRHDNAWRDEAVVTPATGWVVVNLDFDSQRRRLTGRGI